MRAMAGLIVSLLSAWPAHADLAAVTSQNAGALSLIDTASLSVLAEIALPGKPAAVASDGSRGRVMAIAVESRELAVFDLQGKKLGAWPLAGEPFGLAIRPETGTALVTGWEGVLREIDPLNGQEIARWPVGPAASGVDMAEGVIVVANRDADSVTILRPGREPQEVKTGAHPFGVTLHQGRAYVSNVYEDSISVIDIAEGAELVRIPTGARPYAIAFAGQRGFVSNQYSASVTVFDAETLKVTGEIATDEYPEGLAVSSEGRLLVACWFSDSLQVFDAQSLGLIDSLDMPAGPRAFGRFSTALP